jgi:hypothetical protein
MTVKELIEKLNKFDENMNVLVEFDSDGDDFMVKVDVKKVYNGDGVDDSGEFEGDENEKFVIIRLDY